MKRISAIFIMMLAAAVILGACSEPADKNEITKIENVNMEKLKEMAGTYAGDNSKVNSIVQSLPGGETVTEIELSGEEIKVTYGLEEGSGISEGQFNKYWFNGKNVDKQNFYFNAIYLALLVPNSKGYSFEIEDSSLDVTRQQLEKELKEEFKDFPDVTDEEAVTQFIEKNKSKLKELASIEYQAFQ
jgi:uncharacterized protein YcnI